MNIRLGQRPKGTPRILAVVSYTGSWTRLRAERQPLSAETITILVAVFGSITAQIAVLVTLVVRGDRHAKELREEMNRRFDDVNKRFDEVDRRFDDVNKRFDKRFDDVNKRFDDVNKRFDETIREIAEQR